MIARVISDSDRTSFECKLNDTIQEILNTEYKNIEVQYKPQFYDRNSSSFTSEKHWYTAVILGRRS